MTGVMSQSIPSNKLTDDIKLGKVVEELPFRSFSTQTGEMDQQKLHEV